MFPVIHCKKLSETAKIPFRERMTDAGFDIYADEGIMLYPGIPTKIKTGVSLQIPDGHVGIIMDKSSFGAAGVKVFGGVIDSSYRGEIIVVLNYTTDRDNSRNEYGFPTCFEIKKGQKICQILFLETPSFVIQEVDSLNETDRKGGFGSTGEF